MKRVAIILTVVVGLNSFAHEEPQISEKFRKEEQKKIAAQIFEERAAAFKPKFKLRASSDQFNKELYTALNRDSHATFDCIRKTTKTTRGVVFEAEGSVEYSRHFTNIHFFPSGLIGVKVAVQSGEDIVGDNLAAKQQAKQKLQQKIEANHEQIREGKIGKPQVQICERQIIDLKQEGRDNVLRCVSKDDGSILEISGNWKNPEGAKDLRIRRLETFSRATVGITPPSKEIPLPGAIQVPFDPRPEEVTIEEYCF